MHKIAASLSALLLTLGQAAAADTPDRAPERIVVRATSVLPDVVSDALIDVSQPLTMSLEPTMQAETLLQSHCGGSVSNHYIQAFTALNAASAPFMPRTNRIDILVPACAKIRRNATVPVLPGDNPTNLLDRELGALLTTKLMICPPDQSAAGCRLMLAGDAITQRLGPVPGRFDELAKPPTEVWLPFASSWTTLTLKPGITAATAVKRLTDAAVETLARQDLLKAQAAPDVDITAPLDANDPQLSSGPCSPSNPAPADWPFDHKAVRGAIEAAVAFAHQNFANYPIRTVIRVADTGVGRLEATPGFDIAFLAVNPLARQRAHGPVPFTGAYYGINAEAGGEVAPLVNDPNRDHGTEVADLALGTAAFRLEYPDLAKLLGLTVARVFSDRSSTGVWVSVPMLESSLSYQPPMATLINFSVGGVQPLQSLQAVLPRLFEQRQLLVIAAGNTGSSLNRTPLYPATYAADERVRAAIIVVGAHAPALPGQPVTRAAFSNFGRVVDLLAPGCRLPAPFGAAGTLAGTSFAAPLVTFTASLLRAILPDSDSKVVRQRLWATVRWVSDDISNATAFGGVLDIPAALRVFDDTVRLKGGSLLVGRWLDAQPFEGCAGGDTLNADSILRIRVEPLAEGLPRLHILTRDVGGMVAEEPPCIAATDQALDLRTEDGKTVSLKWADIEALIPAVDSADRRVPAVQRVASVERAAAPDPSPTPAPNPNPNPNRSSFPEPPIQIIQSALAAAVGITVTPDGTIGPATSRAIRNFQLSRLEAPSGQLTKAQKRALVAILALGHERRSEFLNPFSRMTFQPEPR